MLRPMHCGIIICLDVHAFVTWLRSLVHEERGKVQQAGNIQEAQFVNMGADAELDASFVSLLRSKCGFLPKFCCQIMHELWNPDSNDGWNAADLIGADQFIAFIMPEKSGVLMPRGSGVRYDGRRRLSAVDVNGVLDTVCRQGQGEAMVFKVVLRWLALLSTEYSPAVAAQAKMDIVCQDTDGLCGYQGPTVVSLLRRFANVSAGLPDMRIWLTVAEKDDRKLERLGLLEQQRQRSRCLAAANGDGLIVCVDLVKLHDAMEADAEAPAGDPGARTIGGTSMLLSLCANDVKRGLHSIGVSKIFDAYFSKRFCDFAAAHGGQLIAIGPAVATGPTLPEEVPFLSIRLEYWAAAALLYAVFSELPEITRQLSKVYSESQLQDMSTRLSPEYDNYTVLRAGCDVSLRQVRLPTVPALMAFISQALLAFGQWCSWLGRRDPRPSTAAAEVHGHSYSVRSNGVKLLYLVELTRPSSGARAAATPGTDAFFREQFGVIIGAPALDPLFDEPKKAIKLAFDRGRGGEPVIEVPMELAVAKGTALSVGDTKALREFTGRYDDCGSNGVVVKSIVRHTVAQVRDTPSLCIVRA